MPVAHRIRRGLAIVAALVLLPLLAACGFDEQTDQVYTPSDGANARTAEMDVLNAMIVSGTPGNGVFIAGLNNNDPDRADQLLSVQAEKLNVGAGGSATIPANGFVNLADSKGLLVTGSKDLLDQGKFVLVKLTFKRAGAITLQVPVVENVGPYATLAPSASPAA